MTLYAWTLPAPSRSMRGMVSRTVLVTRVRRAMTIEGTLPSRAWASTRSTAESRSALVGTASISGSGCSLRAPKPNHSPIPMPVIVPLNQCRCLSWSARSGPWGEMPREVGARHTQRFRSSAPICTVGWTRFARSRYSRDLLTSDSSVPIVAAMLSRACTLKVSMASMVW